MQKRRYYGFIGNGETAALVGPDLSVRWLCIPRFDGTPVLAGALDPNRGGRLSLRLRGESARPISLQPERQAYRRDTAILETTAVGEGWRVSALDFMPWGGHGLVREIALANETGREAAVALEAVVEPIRSAAFPVTVRREQDATLVAAGDGCMIVAPRWEGTLSVPAGGTVTVRLLVGYGATEEQARAALAELAGADVEAEARFWRGWISRAKAPAGPVPEAWLENYRLSLIVMKLLSYAPTGALIAAPTASFPAVPGGSDNWDYRYLWLRDGYYTAMSFDAAGLHEEARRFYDFAFSLQGEDGHWRQPLYTVDGADPAEFIAEDLQGPGGEKPMRFGNAASGQLQLDNEGNIVHGLWFHYRTSGDRTALERHWEGVRRACNWTMANWRRVESGIWELRQYTAHWVHGKAMCYAALVAGARIAAVLGHAAEAEAWRKAADEVRQDVVTNGWNQQRQAYLRHYGEGTPEPCVDISVLALAFYGLLPPDDPRMKATVALIEKDQREGGLVQNGGVCRYDYAAVPFYLPTLWLARYYLMVGRVADCDRLIETCLACATDLGLMAEHFDGRTGEQWGNFPQAFSHEEMARLILERAQGWSFHRWEHE